MNEDYYHQLVHATTQEVARYLQYEFEVCIIFKKNISIVFATAYSVDYLLILTFGIYISLKEGLTLADARECLKFLLTVAPSDFPSTINVKIGKIIEYQSYFVFPFLFIYLCFYIYFFFHPASFTVERYEYQTIPITVWTDIKKINSKWNVGLWKGDITTLRIDVIVNAANKYLLGMKIRKTICYNNFPSITYYFKT